MNPARPILCFCLCFFAIAATAPRAHGQPAPTAPLPYMRLGTNDANVVQLEIAARKFTPAQGTGSVIWLTAVSHIGETNYYQALQKHLDSQALVLFEGIGGEAMKRTRHAGTNIPSATATQGTNSTTRANKSELSTLQTVMARSLDLVFQLDVIDYDRVHFRNSDISVAELQKLVRGTNAVTTVSPSAPAKGRPADDELQKLLKMMDGASAQGALFQSLFQFIGANPRLQAVAKLTLIEILGSLRGDLAQARGLPLEMKRLFRILIDKRNEAVLADLRAELARPAPAKTIALFYGAAHMDDFERQLRALGYRPTDELWLPAFTLDLEKSGVTAFELGLVRGMVRMQMQKMFPAEETPARE